MADTLHHTPKPDTSHALVTRTTTLSLPMSLQRVKLVSLGLLLVTGVAQAQYKVVGPDGKITYTDRPPVGTKAQAVGSGSGGGAVPTGNLPYELQQVVTRFPVTLYASSDCAPCDSGRALLKQRGVPFVERTVSTPEDSAAFKRIEGVTDLPVLRIGGQQLKGFEADEWNGYLSTAGYPAQSKLPSSYSYPAPSPLSPKAAATDTRQPAATSPAPTPSTGSAPSGFRF
jgi:glutaredoxin